MVAAVWCSAQGWKRFMEGFFCRTVLECCAQVHYSAMGTLRKGSGREAVRFWANKISGI